MWSQVTRSGSPHIMQIGFHGLLAFPAGLVLRETSSMNVSVSSSALHPYGELVPPKYSPVDSEPALIAPSEYPRARAAAAHASGVVICSPLSHAAPVPRTVGRRSWPSGHVTGGGGDGVGGGGDGGGGKGLGGGGDGGGGDGGGGEGDGGGGDGGGGDGDGEPGGDGMCSQRSPAFDSPAKK